MQLTTDTSNALYVTLNGLVDLTKDLLKIAFPIFSTEIVRVTA